MILYVKFLSLLKLVLRSEPIAALTRESAIATSHSVLLMAMSSKKKSAVSLIIYLFILFIYLLVHMYNNMLDDKKG